jgi:hypothetical protein
MCGVADWILNDLLPALRFAAYGVSFLGANRGRIAPIHPRPSERVFFRLVSGGVSWERIKPRIMRGLRIVEGEIECLSLVSFFVDFSS